MDLELSGKVCLITGGAGSLGIASAKALTEEGARIVLVDRDGDALSRALESLGLQEDRLITIKADVALAHDAHRYVQAAVDHFGKIDVLFSNAGNFGTVAPIENYPTEVFDDVPHMKRGGSVIITSSVAGMRGDPGVYGYITAKHALTGLMRVLAKDLAPRGIRVNTINPGPISNGFQQKVEDDLGQIIGRDATEFFDSIIPFGRHASPEEVARTVVYLASSQSSFTTGAVISVDGGMSV